MKENTLQGMLDVSEKLRQNREKGAKLDRFFNSRLLKELPAETDIEKCWRMRKYAAKANDIVSNYYAACGHQYDLPARILKSGELLEKVGYCLEKAPEILSDAEFIVFDINVRKLLSTNHPAAKLGFLYQIIESLLQCAGAVKAVQTGVANFIAGVNIIAGTIKISGDWAAKELPKLTGVETDRLRDIISKMDMRGYQLHPGQTDPTGNCYDAQGNLLNYRVEPGPAAPGGMPTEFSMVPVGGAQQKGWFNPNNVMQFAELQLQRDMYNTGRLQVFTRARNTGNRNAYADLMVANGYWKPTQAESWLRDGTMPEHDKLQPFAVPPPLRDGEIWVNSETRESKRWDAAKEKWQQTEPEEPTGITEVQLAGRRGPLPQPVVNSLLLVEQGPFRVLYTACGGTYDRQGYPSLLPGITPAGPWAIIKVTGFKDGEKALINKAII